MKLETKRKRRFLKLETKRKIRFLKLETKRIRRINEVRDEEKEKSK